MPLFNTFTRTIFNTAQGLTLLPPNLGGPSLLRDWTTYQTLDHLVGPAIEFTRGSTATFVGSNGLIQSAATNAPRFDYDPVTLACRGLLIEEQRTNLCLQSQNFATTWANSRCNIASGSNDPTGGTGAFSVAANAVNGFHVVNISPIGITPGSTVTGSVFVKANGLNNFQIIIDNGAGNGVLAVYNLASGTVANTGTNGTATVSASIQNQGNGWYRCVVTGTIGASDTFCRLSLFPHNSSTAGWYPSWTGDGTSGVLLYGAQVEAGSFPTSYIPTTTASVTRSADVAQITGSNFTSFYNQSAGTLFASAVPFSPITYATSQTFLEASDGTPGNRVSFFRNPSNGLLINRVVTSGTQANPDASSIIITSNGQSKIALASAVSSANSARNAVLGTSSSPASMPTVTRLAMGYSNASAGAFLNGWLSAIAYYPSRLTDAQLQALTA